MRVIFFKYMFIAHLRFCPPVFISEMAKIPLARFLTRNLWDKLELPSVLRTTMRQAGLFGEEAARCLESTSGPPPSRSQKENWLCQGVYWVEAKPPRVGSNGFCPLDRKLCSASTGIKDITVSVWQVPDTWPDPIFYDNSQSIPNWFSKLLGIFWYVSLCFEKKTLQ